MTLDIGKKHYAELIKGNKIKVRIEPWKMTVYMRSVQNLSVVMAAKIKASVAKDNALGAAEVLHFLATTSSDTQNDKLAFGSESDLHDLKYNVQAEVVMQAFTDWVAGSTDKIAGDVEAVKKQ